MVAAGVIVWRLIPPIIGKKPDGQDTALDSFPVVIRTNGGLLEVATVTYRETHKLRNVAVVLGHKLPFCPEEATVTIDPHVTYRVRLAKRWQADYRNGTLTVVAPALEPALPVAFDTSRFDSSLSKCRLMPSMDTRNDLIRSLSARLVVEAKAPSRVDFARDHGARDTVREFVQKWLLTQRDFQNLPTNTFVQVEFADER